jgi:hypothetical protein
LQGIDQDHAKDERRKQQEPTEEKPERDPAEHGRQRQQRHHGDEPGVPFPRHKNGTHDHRESRPQLGRRGSRCTGLFVMAVMMTEPVFQHGGSFVDSFVKSFAGLRTSTRPSTSANPNTTTVPRAPASAVAPAAEWMPGKR